VEQELFLVMGGLAWGFEIGKKKDQFGRETYVSPDKYTSLLIAKPEQFEFEMRSVKEGRQQEIGALWRSVNGGQVEDLVDDLSVQDVSVPIRSENVEGDVLIDV